MNQKSETKTDDTITKAAAKIINHNDAHFIEIYIATPFAQIVTIATPSEVAQIVQELNERLFELSQDKTQ